MSGLSYLCSLEQLAELESVRQQYKREIERLIQYNEDLQKSVRLEFDQRQIAERRLEVPGTRLPFQVLLVTGGKEKAATVTGTAKA